MSDLAQRMLEVEWQYADKDTEAHAELKGRIVDAASRLQLIWSEPASAALPHFV